jgi:Flp pilus assembly protein TadB
VVAPVLIPQHHVILRAPGVAARGRRELLDLHQRLPPGEGGGRGVDVIIVIIIVNIISTSTSISLLMITMMMIVIVLIIIIIIIIIHLRHHRRQQRQKAQRGEVREKKFYAGQERGAYKRAKDTVCFAPRSA